MPELPCPPEVQIFTLDGEKHNGIDAFMDKLLAKDISVTPDQETSDTALAREYGYSHPAEAINSVNKMLRREAEAETKQDKLSKLEKKKAAALKEAEKPVIEIGEILNKEFAAMGDPDKIKAEKKKYADIQRRRKILEDLINCP